MSSIVPSIQGLNALNCLEWLKNVLIETSAMVLIHPRSKGRHAKRKKRQKKDRSIKDGATAGDIARRCHEDRRQYFDLEYVTARNHSH